MGDRVSRVASRLPAIVAMAAVTFALAGILVSSFAAVVVAAPGDWPTYNHDAARSGVSSDQAALGAVQLAWTSPELDGRLIYAQPLVIGDRVLVATEGNTVASIDASTGIVVWSTNLGAPVPKSDLPGGNIDPSGITGTPVVDVASGTIFVVAFLRTGPHHELFAIDLATGTVSWHRAIDPPGLSPLVEQQRPALALTGGRVYVCYGGLNGDLGQYKGAIVSAASDGTGSLTSYVVPTSRMGGIWNPAGASVDSNGDLWVITGNTVSQSAFDYGNSVIRLSPGLSVLDYFAPTNWAALNAADLDLNSLGQTLLPGGRVLAVGKNGVAYLLDGEQPGPRERRARHRQHRRPALRQHRGAGVTGLRSLQHSPESHRRIGQPASDRMDRLGRHRVSDRRGRPRLDSGKHRHAQGYRSDDRFSGLHAAVRNTGIPIHHSGRRRTAGSSCPMVAGSRL